ncbi:PREDICTED: protocadherin Fat 4-like [Buceros rhinoceros silvestris]|nr:PREDICTED: protocadherin Fat 4-like [Buceros rhinoceros silvestris]
MAPSKFLAFALISWVTFICLEAQKITTISCDVTPNPIVLSSFLDNYTGDIEWITNIPPNADLKLAEYLFPEHQHYVELVYEPGSSNATVRTREPLDVDSIESDYLFYAVICQRTGTVSAINVTVIKVKAEDKDFSPLFNLITYSLWGPNSDYFHIREGDGNIMLKKTLDYNKINLFNLTVQAKEKMGNNSDTASVIITVQDYDTLNPYFSQSVYTGKISEHQSGPLTVLPEKILAKDGDTGINEKVLYSIKLVEPPAYNDTFLINVDTGELEVRTAVDREVCPYLIVGIQAAQQDQVFKTADAVVLVTIEDVNDNPPVFSQPSYNISILENLPNGMNVLQVTATDRDEGGFQGTFTLTPADGAFQISQTGLLTVRNSALLDREETPSLQLQVIARDHLSPYQEANSTINILLLDENDNSPTFRGTPYKQDIFINMTAGMSILQVAAADPDEGTNGEISFVLAGGNEDGYFQLDESTGQITLKTVIPLGVNQLKNFVLWITAIDGGTVPRSSSVPVQISAVGDSRPRFIQKTYNVSVEEELVSPVEVATVEYESLNPHIPVTFRVLPESAPFEVDGNGIISTTAKLDYESQNSYTLNLSLSDGDIADYATVFIQVTDVNDNSPVFGVTSTTITVPENSPDQTVTSVSATDADEGFNGLVVYTLKGAEGKMDINTSGSIFLEKVLDREEQAFYNLMVIASDQGQPPLSTALNLTVIVGDENDNPPVFSSVRYEVNVFEDEVLGRELLTVTATDMDAGANALVKYRIVSQQPPTSLPVFLVNSTTGQLSLSQQLDYETIKQFEVEVEASDGGQLSLSSNTRVVVHVLDVNDNPPEFNQAAYDIFVLENLPKGSPIYTFTVTDKDEAGFSQGHFIHNSTSFTVDIPGILSLSNDTELDRETTPGFTLQVWAVDAETNGLNSSALFHVTVLDVNDNNPEFQMLPYRFAVLEGDYVSGAPASVGRVRASDLDEGENARITYYLSAEDGDNPYSIQQDGTIVVNGDVDRETKEKYELLVVASDNGVPQRQNFTYVSIQVLDVNDNPPRFTRAQYSASVRVATAKEGMSILSVSATDLDIGNNSLISYSLMNHSDDFHINNRTGEIVLGSNLGHVTADTVVTLVVIAADHGVPQLMSNASVTLYLLVSDTSFGLAFESSSYEFSIEENEPPGTAVGSVRAVTGSIAVQVAYSLKPHGDKFSVSDQGDIVALARLDREDNDLYSIIVEAVDSVVPPNTAVALVTVRVNDINDNPPVFSAVIQTQLSAPENEASLSLGVFAATDLDIGVNALISYSLQDDFAGTFHINSSTGELTTKKPLDRESMDSYELKIIAADSGKPPQSASLVLSVTVEDVNDNPPVFPQEPYSVTVKENEPPHVILSAVATDEDIGYNAVIHYTILGETASFYVGELSGNLTTLQPLDYESRAQYTFVLKAFNPAEPYLQDTTNVTVTVEDVNEEGPLFDQPSYYRILPDNSTAGTLVVDINASDESKGYDEGIFYNISGGNPDGLFSLSSATGVLTLTRDLSKQTSPLYYSLMVTATDSGLPPLSTSVKVSVVIAPISFSLPVFSEAAYQPAPLSEKALPDTFVVQVSASYEVPVLYSVVPANGTEYFIIDPSTGVVRTKKNLKLEDFPVVFTVRATDPSNAGIFNEASVKVEVIDENDFPPVFPSSLLEERLEENLPPTQIVQLKAQDNDTGRNGLLTYGILSGDELKFRIDNATGILYSTASFDYEEEPTEYQVVIYAEDDGIPEKKRGYCTVVVKIVDVNDWPPVFDPVTVLSVNENAPVGFVVGKVTATDRDTGDNAFVLYVLTVTGSSSPCVLSQLTVVADGIPGGGGNTFEIDELHGDIKIKNSPDYETVKEYNLTVSAVNNRSAPFHQATTHVTVLVIDVNDNPPVFAQNSYSASINMINPVGTHVITVSATDEDQGQNGLIEYSILPDQNLSPAFLIEDTREGRIITTGNLSRSGEMRLTVMARDKGSPPLNDTAVVTLTVFDNSPFVPRFNTSEISVSVPENTGVDYLIYTFTVVETSGKQVDYTIVSGNEKGHFRLDPTSGQLRTAVNLDYEEVSQYVILIEANENLSAAAEVRCSGLFAPHVAMLTLSVQDVNEAPAFQGNAYSARIPNVVPYRYPVISVQVGYLLKDGISSRLHWVKVAGFVLAAVESSRLHVQREKCGSTNPEYSSPAPRNCGDGVKSKKAPSRVPQIACFYTQATDPDSGDNGRLRYSLVNQHTNEFDIDENSGQVFAVSVAGKAGTFPLEVQAADQGTRQLTARTTVEVTVDSSSSNNIVMVVLDQQINVVERNIADVKRVLAAKLAWSVFIIDVYANELGREARSSTDVTYIKILAFDEANQEVPAADVKRKLREQKSDIELELEKVFSASVTAAVQEPPADSPAPEPVATIVLGVLLACTLVAFLVYVVLTVKRKRKAKRRAQIAGGTDNPCATDDKGTLQSSGKPEHTDLVRNELIAFSNVGDPKGGDADKSGLQAEEDCRYLETRDCSADWGEKAASEQVADPRTVDARPAAGSTPKQVMSRLHNLQCGDCRPSSSGGLAPHPRNVFLQDGFPTEPALALVPDPPAPASAKELKGVKFSEVAVILDAGSEADDPDDHDDLFINL